MDVQSKLESDHRTLTDARAGKPVPEVISRAPTTAVLAERSSCGITW
jgi:hypothetical protein